MNKTDLKDVLALVKTKLKRDTEAACGLFWPDAGPSTTLYSVGEEDATTHYAVGEEDSNSDYSVGEEDPPVSTLYGIGEED